MIKKSGRFAKRFRVKAITQAGDVADRIIGSPEEENAAPRGGLLSYYLIRSAIPIPQKKNAKSARLSARMGTPFSREGNSAAPLNYVNGSYAATAKALPVFSAGSRGIHYSGVLEKERGALKVQYSLDSRYRYKVYDSVDTLNTDDNSGVESVTRSARLVDDVIHMGKTLDRFYKQRQTELSYGSREAETAQTISTSSSEQELAGFRQDQAFQIQQTNQAHQAHNANTYQQAAKSGYNAAQQSNYRRAVNYYRATQAANAQSKAAVAFQRAAAGTVRAAIASTKTAVTGAAATVGGAAAPVLLVVIAILAIFVIILLAISGVSGGAGYNTDESVATETTMLMTEHIDDLIDLLNEIESLPEYEHIEYFEYDPSLDEMIQQLSFDPFALQAYLNVIFNDGFTADDVRDVIEDLFQEMFELELLEEDETFYITLISKDLDTICRERLADDEEGLELYELYMDTGGGLQVISNPFDIDWRPHVSSPFSNRQNPTDPEEGIEYHTGLDIALPEGTPIKAGVTGTVVYTRVTVGGYGKHVMIKNLSGKVTVLYAHMSEILVSDGDMVIAGVTKIGRVGKTGRVTGPHVHIEVRGPDGKLVDPIFVLSYNAKSKE